ncbi:MAG: N-acetyltransferase [Oscillospiraceae bacterium]|nr:N-acetyltransferase [Oscillospiraceae bacterium]
MEIKFMDNKSVAVDNGKNVGECVFIESGDVWNIIHTEVDSAYQGQGIAKKLVVCVIENSKRLNKKLVSDCSYAKKVIDSM